MCESIYSVWLSECRYLSNKKKKFLVELFGSPKEVYFASEDDLVASIIAYGEIFGNYRKSRLKFDKSLQKAENSVAKANACGADILGYDSPDYPEHLKEISDPPMVLYSRGLKELIKAPGVAIVGTRRASQYGRWAAFEISRRVAQCGVPVISGMAEGIDSAAHSGCLSGGAGTVAVFGTGIDLCFPASNKSLCRRIAQEGLILSEFAPGERGFAAYFPLRNRVISALSKAVIVVEGAIKSGSLITASLAADQGRDVFAVPGNINQPNSVGCNKLISEGAFPIMDLEEVASVLGLESRAQSSRCEMLSSEEKRLFLIVKQNGSIAREILFRTFGGPAQNTAGLLTILELKGFVKTEGSKIYVAK